jgi:hypothetical protein
MCLKHSLIDARDEVLRFMHALLSAQERVGTAE